MSSVAGWMVAARGSEWTMSPFSNSVTAMPARPSIRATMSPTGPPPAMITAGGICTEHLFGGDRGLGRHHFLHGADPSRMGEVEDDAVGVLVFHLVIGVRIVVGAAHIVRAPGRHHLLGRCVEIVDQHAEMNEAIMDRRKTGHFAGELEQGDIDGAVGHVKPDAGAAGNRHAERLLKEFRGLFGVRDREGDVTKTGGHGELLLEGSNLDRKIPPRLRSQAGRKNRLRGAKAFPDQVGPTLLSSPGLTGSRACPTSAPIKWSKSETSDFDWRSSKQRPWILDCPVKPGNDTGGSTSSKHAPCARFGVAALPIIPRT